MYYMTGASVPSDSCRLSNATPPQTRVDMHLLVPVNTSGEDGGHLGDHWQ